LSGVYSTASWRTIDTATAIVSHGFDSIGVSRSQRMTYRPTISRKTKAVNTIVIAYGVMDAAPSSV